TDSSIACEFWKTDHCAQLPCDFDSPTGPAGIRPDMMSGATSGACNSAWARTGVPAHWAPPKPLKNVLVMSNPSSSDALHRIRLRAVSRIHVAASIHVGSRRFEAV